MLMRVKNGSDESLVEVAYEVGVGFIVVPIVIANPAKKDIVSTGMSIDQAVTVFAAQTAQAAQVVEVIRGGK